MVARISKPGDGQDRAPRDRGGVIDGGEDRRRPAPRGDLGRSRSRPGGESRPRSATTGAFGHMTVADALDRYEAAVATPAARQASRKMRMVLLRRALEPFNSRPVASLTRGELLLRLDEVQTSRGPIARNRAQSEIRVWSGWLHNRDLVPSIVIDRVKKAVKEQARERVLNDEEIKAVLANTTDRSPFNDIVRVLVHTAMRRGEAANLRRVTWISKRARSRCEAKSAKPGNPARSQWRTRWSRCCANAFKASPETDTFSAMARTSHDPSAVSAKSSRRWRQQCRKASLGHCTTSAEQSRHDCTKPEPTRSQSKTCSGI